MASEKAWTAVLKGYFTTTILPSIASRDGDGFTGPRGTPPDLDEIRATFRRLLAESYGEPLEATAEAALSSYLPSWESVGQYDITYINRWSPETGASESVAQAPSP